MIPRVFPTSNGDNKLELNFDADALIDVKALASYDFLNMDELMIEDESSYLYFSLNALYASELLWGSIASDIGILQCMLKIFKATLRLPHAPPWNIASTIISSQLL